MSGWFARVAPVVRYSIGLAVIVLTFFFLGRSLVNNWGDLRAEQLDIQPALLVFSGLLLSCDIMMRSFVWWDLVRHFAGPTRPSYLRLARVFLYSWLGRYVPGKIAYVVGRFYLGRHAGASTGTLVASMAYENVIIILTAMGLSAILLVPTLAIESETFWPYLTLPVAAVAGAVVLHPAILRRLLHLAMRLTGGDAPEVDRLLSPALIARTVGLSTIVFLFSGVGFYVMVASITDYPIRYLPLAAGTITLAAVAGVVTVITPAGLGVREGVIVAILQFTMPVELAVLVSVVARLWATVVDLIVVGAGFGFDYLSGERLLLSFIAGRSVVEDSDAAGVGGPG